MSGHISRTDIRISPPVKRQIWLVVNRRSVSFAEADPSHCLLTRAAFFPNPSYYACNSCASCLQKPLRSRAKNGPDKNRKMVLQRSMDEGHSSKVLLVSLFEE